MLSQMSSSHNLELVGKREIIMVSSKLDWGAEFQGWVGFRRNGIYFKKSNYTNYHYK